MGVQIERLVEGKFTLNSLLESGVSEESLSKVERALKLPTSSRDEKLYFVGFFELGNKLFISFPKSLDIDLLTDQHSRVLMTLMRRISANTNVTNKIPDNSFLRKSYNIENLSRLNLAEFILFDFLKHGDITFKSSKNITNQIHEPNWTKTLESIVPVISGANHIYDYWISNKKWLKHDHIIKEIHYAVLNECMQRYGMIFDVNEKEIDFARTKAPILPKNAIKLLESKLREVYVQRDVLVLKALKNWLEMNDKSSNFEFYGTQYFHVVWEEVCSYLLNNRKDEQSWKAAFEKPQWLYYDTKEIKYSNSFEVDIICQDLKDKLVLADAKYYDITMRENGILGVSDLSKQINYETQLSKSETFIKNYHSKDKLINLFIFPAQNSEAKQKVFCEIILALVT
jgi:hypothetical protein